MFQFHTGSIKRDSVPVSLFVQTHRFNSILVRLKAIRPDVVLTGPSVFQFHTGSIKSNVCQAVLVFFCGFNSILVRLKDAPFQIRQTPIVCFNSILVRLKVYEAAP